ncbi:MAG: ABC transporter substrate-binding protein [Desulfovibrionales bacterium]
MHARQWVLSLVLLLFMAAQADAQGEIHPAVERVRGLTETLSQAMNASELDFSGRYDLIRPVVEDLFALELMARLSTGRYWRDLSPDQREQLISLYADWSAASYANRFDEPGSTFEVNPEVTRTNQGILVESSLLRPDNGSVAFTYMLRPAESKWRIFDIRVRGVSQLANTRAQFVPLLKNEGFDGLVRSIREKIEDLSGPDAGQSIVPE